MMKTIRFIMFLFYRYYKSGRPEPAPYFHALSSVSFMIFLHVAAFLLFIGKTHFLFGANKNASVIKFLVLYSFCLLVLRQVASRKELDEADYAEASVKKGNRLLVLYVGLSIALMIVSIVTSNGNKTNRELNPSSHKHSQFLQIA